MANEITGNTESTESIDENPYTHIIIESIFDEEYREETQRYIFTFYTYSGDQYIMHLSKKDIERFNLFMRKSDAEQKWLKHIITN